METKKRLDLYLDGPMQSWGTAESWYKIRRTEGSPTKTAIAGLIGCCMGIDWEETEELKTLSDSFEIIDSEHTRIPPRPKRMSDHQTIYIGDYIDAGIVDGFKRGNGGIKSTNSGITRSQQFIKDYLEDTKFVITIEGQEEVLNKVRHALLHPMWQPYLGRACCVPSGPFIRGDVY